MLSGPPLKIHAVVHKAEEGDSWLRFPPRPAAQLQGETLEELKPNLSEAIEGCLSVEIRQVELAPEDQVLELAV
jgi:predicted RNase H-like HicB family nuclease